MLAEVVPMVRSSRDKSKRSMMGCGSFLQVVRARRRMEASEKINVLVFISILYWTALRRAQGPDKLKGVAEAEFAFDGLEVSGDSLGREGETAQVELESGGEVHTLHAVVLHLVPLAVFILPT